MKQAGGPVTDLTAVHIAPESQAGDQPEFQAHFSTLQLSPATGFAGLDLILLTHQTEFLKDTNTGVLVAAIADPRIQVRRVLWSRVAPDNALLAAIKSQPCFLLYPRPAAQLLDVDKWQQFWQQSQQAAPVLDGNNSNAAPRLMLILLDATWQLAGKMYNQSVYLKHLPAISLRSSTKSVYQLRRNQQDCGWCTAESVQLLLSACGYQQAAIQLQQLFLAFNQRPGSAG